MLFRIAIRTCFVIFSTGVTLIVRSPARFGPFLDLVSACTSTFTVFILPCVFYVKLRGVRTFHPVELGWNVLIVLLSLVGATFGTIDAVGELVNSYRLHR
jgi:hypothetical protein